jgi:hypothetical protein
MVNMTIQVPEELAEQITAVQDRLPELLKYGLQELPPLPNETYRYVLKFLVKQPSPKEVMDFEPTAEMQERASMLLQKNREGTLTPVEQKELDEYVQINHLVTMLKARVLPYLTPLAA